MSIAARPKKIKIQIVLNQSPDQGQGPDQDQGQGQDQDQDQDQDQGPDLTRSRHVPDLNHVQKKKREDMDQWA